MQPSAPPHLEPTKTIFSNSITKLVVFICWLAILADGYDLGIYGAVLPKLLEDNSWALSPAHAGTIASYALFGMFIGAILVGTITDLIGRKWTLICCLALFSTTMGLAALAPSPELFGLWRFIGGIGLGGVIPTASALTVEYSPKKRQSFIYALMFTGYPLGIVLGAILSMFMLEDFGWRIMFGIGMIPLLLIPFIIRYLPESIQFLLSRNRQEVDKILNRFQIEFHAKEKTHQPPSNIRKKNGFLTLFSKEYIKATLLFWITYIMGMFLIYGLNTWLPQMMRQAGYPLGSSLSFLLMLNITAAIGALFAGAIADRIGAKIVISISYLMAAVCIGLLTIKPSVTIIYLLIGLAGIGSVGITQILNAYVTQYFPSHIRATSLGWGLGLGRVGAITGPILVGIIMTMQYDLVWNFYLFSFAGLLAAISVFFIPTK
ncbi:aromatic acid/H+ symport family MFS transporter [Bacillus cereus group sp. Bc005]|uniref:MFS transporter n=1 Tax=unclassified Bacillus cereus group TaxID=2750818 RepID=UPI0022E466D9|nr:MULTISPECIES: aromatic acid/H+ symport family MFS transporter [unclassified Bacillus cereus group]MDA2757134.1 aromatic acid/H+ symport family MFS transporter [Bacillus cereus group sp. Bc007]MDA2762804.1 aromatic acid/H+ symport family MFS transporter [Bacillus cereus group sp. Bc008]MDA2773875.1 aromatic acid/H+ symport family MFS transporter [Bacillus cereus group sp. Bc005]